LSRNPGRLLPVEGALDMARAPKGFFRPTRAIFFNQRTTA